MLKDLLKATVGVAIDLPLSVAKDVVTLGGSLTEEEPATGESLDRICKNIENAIDPEEE